MTDAALAAARAGDEGAFRQLVEPYRRELHAHCYRMLGSLHDAEDALQETLLAAWRGLARFEGRSSLRSWLYRIATNECLDVLEQRPRRALPVGDVPSGETAWVEPYPDERLGVEDGFAAPEATYERRESVELAFIAALQHLPARQRAALIMRDVLGFSAKETAESLETTVASANGALRRARDNVAGRLPERSQQATLRALGDRGVRAVVSRYMDALDRGDADALVAMLAEDAAWSMPPLHEYYRGHAAILGFLHTGPLRERWRHLPTTANGQAAVGCYMWDERRGTYPGRVIDVLTLEGEAIAAVTSFVGRELFEAFGLPGELPEA
jgi:RNA polymerase sigma-70 factor, ECF subfamily